MARPRPRLRDLQTSTPPQHRIRLTSRPVRFFAGSGDLDSRTNMPQRQQHRDGWMALHMWFAHRYCAIGNSTEAALPVVVRAHATTTARRGWTLQDGTGPPYISNTDMHGHKGHDGRGLATRDTASICLDYSWASHSLLATAGCRRPWTRRQGRRVPPRRRSAPLQAPFPRWLHPSPTALTVAS